MTEIELIKDLEKKYSREELNEAETRFKIIDEILDKYLKWPKESSFVEKYIDGNRADYILNDKNLKPVLVIESKKQGKYFKLPSSYNSKNNFQKILLEKLITDENIKEAVFQVKEYCEDILCDYACICNGFVWIIFKVTPSNNKPWKKLPAIVLKDLSYFKDNYTDAINLLGYYSVLNELSLQSEIGINRRTYSEIFYPKNSITAYDTPVNSNTYASSLSVIGRKYLGVIPETDSEFMNSCYVTNKGHYDRLQNNVQGFLYDSLTPYFKNQGFRGFTDNKEGGAFGVNIIKIIKRENLDNVMILFGGRGSGKSTFLKRFLFHIRPIEIDIYAKVALVDLIDSPQTSQELTAEIWERTLNEIDKENLKEGSREEILELFKEEFEVYNRQILTNLDESDSEYQKLTREFIQNHISNTKLFAEKLSTKLKEKNKGLIVFLDNMDQLNVELQDICYLTAVEIAKKLSCLVIISMREERFYNAKTKGVLDAYHTPGYHLTAPVIPEVLIKRIRYILDELTFTEDIDLEFNIKNDLDLNSIKNFLKICSYQLKNDSSELSLFLRYATHGDVRQALEFFKGFITSGYTNIDEISKHRNWTFQSHQVIRPMMIPDRIFYDETLSRIPNVLQLRNDQNSSHFTGLRILDLLNNKFGGQSSTGFVDAKFFVQEYEARYSLIKECENYLNLFLSKGLIESSNRLESYSGEVDQIKITAFGKYMFETMIFNFSYIDLVCLECGIYDETLNNFMVESAGNELRLKNTGKVLERMNLRMERASKFIQYLEEQEKKEISEFNIDPNDIKFAGKIREQFKIEKDRILRSIEKNSQEF
jgi:predicted transcriptional regulator